MSLMEALSDLKAEIISGHSLKEVLAEVAGDYDLNPLLLERKFTESYGSEESVRAFGHETSLETRVARAIESQCKKYRVDPASVIEKSKDGVKYTIICRLPDNTVHGLVAVRHTDGDMVKLAWTFFM